MKNEVISAADNQTSPPTVAQRPLGERILELKDDDIRVIQGQGLGTAFANTFDNAFKNGFKNIAQW